MYLYHPVRTFLLWGLLLLSWTRVAASTAGPEGHWEGRIMLGREGVAVIVDLAQSSAGVWTGSAAVPGSTSVDVPITEIVVDGTTVRFATHLPARVSFEGTMAAGEAAIAGTVSNVAGSVPFELKRTGAASVKTPPASTPLLKQFEGTWEGALVVEGKETPLALKLSGSTSGLAAGVLISQGTEIPASTVMLNGNRLELESRAVSGKYTGTLRADGAIEGEWTQGALRLPLTLMRGTSSSRPPLQR
jgi:hypothetical protein